MKLFICFLGTIFLCLACGCSASNKSELKSTEVAWDSHGKPTVWVKQVILNAKDPSGIDSKQIVTFIQDSEGLRLYDPVDYGDAGFAKHVTPAAIYGGTNVLAAHELRPDTFRSNSTINQSGASSAKSGSSAKTHSNAVSDSDSNSVSNSNSNSDADSNSASNSNSNSNANAKTNQSQGQRQGQDQDQGQRQGQNQDQTSKNNQNQENTQKQQNSGKDDRSHR